MSKPLRERFEEKYIPITESGCWLWLGALRMGYGLINVRGKSESAHRVSYKLYKGDIPEGLFVLHSCDIRCCVNPNHLRLGTIQDNSDDMWKRNRQVLVSGEINGMSKLTPEKVKEIREKYIPRKYSLRVLAEEFGIHISTVYEIVTNKIWRLV